ncbi:tRNA (adenosine(37)-N6)-threonylcarbamoyltransferase complex dimerization subunit type 1 TsaB [Glycocaulis profundi]|nr:tRNA (adenosine(37)-N6)-threonylcarbamoyltransferase complex dimerization subunit type 1 TsaB [Glycocaulis profundi]
MTPKPVPGPILVLDTTARWCAAAIRMDGGEVVEIREDMARGHAERLAPMTAELLKRAGLAPAALSRIAAATGPGSFAGTRVGTAFARGLALATGGRAVGVSNLSAWARTADPAGSRDVAAIHDARRGEVVIQIFRHGAALGEPERMGIEQARERLSPDWLLAGSGVPLLGGTAPDGSPLAALIALACELPDDAPPPSPLYARPPDAKLPGGLEPA